MTWQSFNESKFQGQENKISLDPLITIWKPFLIKSGHVTFFSLRTASAASEQKNFDEESIASLSTSAQNETRDGFCPDDLPETSAVQALQDRTYGFSFWPKVSLK